MSKAAKAKFEAEQGNMFVVEKDGTFRTVAKMSPKFDDVKWKAEVLSRPASAREVAIQK